MPHPSNLSQRNYRLGLISGARLVFDLLPGMRGHVAMLTLLGCATSVLDTLAIGVVLLVLQFALDATQTVEGYGALGIVVNFAYELSQRDGWVIGAVIFGILVSHSVLGASYEGLASHLRLQAYQSFRERVFANWIGSELHSLDCKDPGEMVNTVQNETWEAAECVFQFCSLAVAAAMTAVYVFVMAATSPILTAVSASLAILAVVVVGSVRRRLSERSQDSIRQKEALSRHFIGNLHALRTIKAFRAEDAAVHKSNMLSSTLRRTFESIVLLEAAIKPVTGIVSAAALGAVLLVALRLDVPGTVILGFVIVLYRAQPRVQIVFQTLGRLARTLPSVATVAEHVKPVAQTNDDGLDTFGGFENQIRFRGVCFAYPATGTQVIRNLSLTLRKGEMTAVLGASGAGKSTMINLLLRFVEPDDGTITCDGVPIQSFTRASWLERVAVAGQDVELIDGSVRENLLMGTTNTTESRMWQALSVAGAADMVRGLPRGLDAEVGSRGVSLSGGQRQRLCLARALLVDTELLVLDEATNAVDATVERSIYARIREAYPRLTMLVVAHRAAVGMLADHVIVMSEGQVIESGTPGELAEKGESVFGRLTETSTDRQRDARSAG